MSRLTILTPAICKLVTLKCQSQRMAPKRPAPKWHVLRHALFKTKYCPRGTAVYQAHTKT